VQLAVYGAAMAAASGGAGGPGPSPAPPPPRGTPAPAPRAGYYLLKQRRFLTTPDSGLAGSVVRDAPDLATTWEGVVTGWRGWRRRIDEGTLRARGVAPPDGVPDDAEGLQRDARCDRCAFAALCRTKELHHGA